MAKYKIGTTEHGDAGLDLSWVSRLGRMDGAIVITKQVSPRFRDAVLANSNKLVVHATTTGYGGTVLEPNVPPLDEQLNAVVALVQAGFPKEKVVIRVDPAEGVIKAFMDAGFSRFRVSIIDMYPHVRERFKQVGLPLIYGESGFSPSKKAGSSGRRNAQRMQKAAK